MNSCCFESMLLDFHARLRVVKIQKAVGNKGLKKRIALLFIRVWPDFTQPQSDIVLERSELQVGIHVLRAQPFSLCADFLLPQLP